MFRTLSQGTKKNFSTRLCFLMLRQLDAFRTVEWGRVMQEIGKKFGYDFHKIWKKLHHDINKTLLRGVYQKSRRSDGEVIVGRDRKLKISEEKFAWKFLDTLRDSLHSYTLDKNRFEILSIHSGNIPDTIPYLAHIMLINLLMNYENELKQYCFINLD